MIESLIQAHTDIMITQLPEPIVNYRFPHYPPLTDARGGSPGATRESQLEVLTLRFACFHDLSVGTYCQS